MLTLNQKISILQNDLSGLSRFSKEISGGILEDSISSILFLNEKISFHDLLISEPSGLELALDVKQNAISFLSDICLNDLHVHGNINIDGSLNIGNITDLEQKIIDLSNNSSSGGYLLISDTSGLEISTKLDVSNQGTGPALKVSQFGVGDDQDVALFNAGEEGDALKIDSCGNMFVYKDMNVSGDINGNEIQVNSIPINSFTNYIMGADYQFGTGWGRGNIITRQGTQLPFCSHSSQFSENSSGVFYCSQPGTYEITANVVYRNINTSNNTGRQNPCIGVGIDSDTNDYNTPYIAPNWNLMPHGQTPFAVQYVRMNEGKVCSLTVKRIHHFVDSTQEVSIHTYGQPATGDEFQKVLAEYHILNSTIQFKYLGNFDNIT